MVTIPVLDENSLGRYSRCQLRRRIRWQSPKARTRSTADRGALCPTWTHHTLSLARYPLVNLLRGGRYRHLKGRNVGRLRRLQPPRTPPQQRIIDIIGRSSLLKPILRWFCAPSKIEIIAGSSSSARGRHRQDRVSHPTCPFLARSNDKESAHASL